MLLIFFDMSSLSASLKEDLDMFAKIFFLDPTRILTLALKATEQIPKPICICITVSESESDSEMERKARIRAKNSGNRKSNNFKRKPITEIKPFLSEDFWSRNKGKLFLKQFLLS